MDSKPLKYNQIVDLTAARVPAFGLAGNAVPVGSMWALIQAENVGLRWRDDGTAPTAAIGMLLAPGDSMVYDGPLGALQLIQTGTGGVANIIFYKALGSFTLTGTPGSVEALENDGPASEPEARAQPRAVPPVRKGAF